MDSLETNHLDRLGILTAMIGGWGEEDYLLWLIMAETDRASKIAAEMFVLYKGGFRFA